MRTEAEIQERIAEYRKKWGMYHQMGGTLFGSSYRLRIEELEWVLAEAALEEGAQL